jgi:branched-chain amino acid transport system permease protein
MARRNWMPVQDPPLPAAFPLPAAPEPSELKIEGLARHFGGVRAVDGIDLSFAPGEAIGVVGANGSGKSTLVNLIAGVEKPDAGYIRWAGNRIDGLSPARVARAGIARTFQSLKLVDGKSALDNIAGGDWRAQDIERTHGEAMHLLDRLGVGDVAWHLCGTLPPGLRRRVEIARALIARPALLLLDEPAAGLTGEERQALASILSEVNRTGVTLVVIEHDLEFLTGFTSRLVCLDGGRVIADGAPEQVRRNPAVIAAWLGQPAEEPQDG